MIRAIVDDIDRSAKPPPEGPPGGGQTGASGGENTNGEGSMKSHYQAIPVTIEE
ncbi:Uncharacterised protein [Mycobacterium tuberculosis]|uniref:Uncharacterized protein n=1 Tax=Mycobacterium tuberculosis TaxID=1773 RepID=A0A654ZGY4_MYCTX|nr:Uncharacterised protein [Mycobacterium tuberculosis]CKO53125.1 Uncharacterised protein [Mycobacterium tuberculosis]CKS25107.1 Uncharacterised protein [Mycobacterium tuberculosis]CKT38001.1 Uncharacterised protein [Mycobacterium tuberculosis]